MQGRRRISLLIRRKKKKYYWTRKKIKEPKAEGTFKLFTELLKRNQNKGIVVDTLRDKSNFSSLKEEHFFHVHARINAKTSVIFSRYHLFFVLS